eukprot:Nitzschia sp. Nitz4//scaffold17_size182527//98915//100519//NITZ4_001859-RA/size182527-processed-gene-0.57-mRNA-1//-1//CDS//3329539355//1808//frame0
MAKGKSRKNRDAEGSTTKPTSPGGQNRSSRGPNRFLQWCLQEQQGLVWVVACALAGSLIGFGIGSGFLTGQWGTYPPDPWRVAMGLRIRDTLAQVTYNIFGTVLFQDSPDWMENDDDEYEYVDDDGNGGTIDDEDLYEGAIIAPSGHSPRSRAVVTMNSKYLKSHPSHPTIFAVLREAIVRERGGFVHPDLGFLYPAPSGAFRGVGMIRNTWNICQTSCNPGVASEKLQRKQLQEEGINPSDDNSTLPLKYRQEEILIKVPVTFQMTRKVALDTLLPLIPVEAQRKGIFYELDDAALLTLLLAHERGVGKYSRWLPYIASLPIVPSCGYSMALRPHLLDTLQALRDEADFDVHGWPGELSKATDYAARIVQHLSRDYGAYIKNPKGVTATENIDWALCQVASRAIAGSQKHGGLRLVPMADVINHDPAAASFVELTGKEKWTEGDFVEATEDDAGAFVVRSRRYGEPKALRIGQELLVNYNLPYFSALDWFLSMGFVPTERLDQQWKKMDAALPRVRRDGPYGTLGSATRRGTI